MRVVIAVDAYKGSLSSAEAGAAAREGVLRAVPSAQVHVVPVADGGEGTVDALRAAVPASRRVVARTLDALGAPVDAAYVVLPDGTAVVEAASCVGLSQTGTVDAALPPRASSVGVGVLVRHAVDGGARRVAVALGGTSCTDGGLGMLLALGGRAQDAAGGPLPVAGENPLWRFGSLDGSALPDVGVPVVVLTDVDNPLHGPTGAARVFGPQKGATPEQVAHLDDRLVAWGRALAAAGRPVADRPGAGAAGGLGAALLALGASRVSGLTFVAEAAGLPAALAGVDLVLTGEGRVDTQTARGKTPAGIAALAREHAAPGVVVAALAGSVDPDLGPGGGPAPGVPGPFDAVLPVHAGPLPLADAMRPDVAAAALARTAAEVARLVAGARRPLAARRRAP